MYTAVYGFVFVVSALAIPISLLVTVGLYRRHRAVAFLVLSLTLNFFASLALVALMSIGCSDAARIMMGY